MEKWKLGVIAALFATVLGYGSWQALSEQAKVPQTAMPQTGVQQPPSPGEPLMKLETAPEYQKFVGKPLPAWNIPAANWTNGKAISVGQLKGKVTLVEVFRIKCSHCEKAAPHMQHLHDTYGPQGFQIVALQAPHRAPEEHNWPLVQQTVSSWGLTYPIGFDAKAAYFKGKLGGRKVPTAFLLDKEGRVTLALNGLNAKMALALEARIKEELQK